MNFLLDVLFSLCLSKPSFNIFKVFNCNLNTYFNSIDFYFFNE